MAYLDHHPRARWAAPVLAVTLAVGGGLALGQAGAGASTGLVPKTAEELLVSLQQARPQPLSGTVRQEVDLGLPDLSALGSAMSSSSGSAGASGSVGTDPLALLAGPHTWRIWYADPQHARVALVDGTTEQALIRNGRDVWQWSSAQESAHHVTLPAASADDPRPSGAATPPNPTDLAEQVLAALDPSTQVSTASTDTVAGRAAYGLVLTPRSPDTLVGTVRLSVDAETSLPLAASVYAKGAANPVVDVRFTALDLGMPDASMFDFTPPPGTTVTTDSAPAAPPKGSSAGAQPLARPEVVGTGWSAVATGSLPSDALTSEDSSSSGSSSQAAGLLAMLPKVSGSWGSGHLLQSALVCAVVTDDGRYAVGAVPPSVLYAALGSG